MAERRQGTRRRRVASRPDPPPAEEVSPPLVGLEQEIAQLRLMIDELVKARQVEEARRQIQTLCLVFKTRYLLDERAAGAMQQALEQSLAEIESLTGGQP